MVRLNFMTNNFRHGWRGVNFLSINDYIRTLGFLSNFDHYNNNDGIEIRVEKNTRDGACDIEERIYYYGSDEFLNNFPALYEAKSRGIGRVTYRINSNEFINHLLDEYFFVHFENENYITYIQPPTDFNIVINVINQKLMEEYDILTRNQLLQEFFYGYNL